MIVRTEKPCLIRPLLIFGYGESVHAASFSRFFRRHGWEVHQVKTGPEIRFLAALLNPQAVILDTELAGESGWLTAAKLVQTNPEQKIFLLGRGDSHDKHRFATFVGAAGFFCREDSPEKLLKKLPAVVESACVA